MAVAAAMEVWRADKAGAAMAGRILTALKTMATAVESVDDSKQQSQYHDGDDGVAQAVDAVNDM